MSVFCLCTAIFTATPATVSAEAPKGYTQISYGEEELIELFNKSKQDGTLEKHIARILKESGREGSAVIGTPVELKYVNLQDKKVLQYRLPEMLVPVSQDGILLGAVKFYKVLYPGEDATRDKITSFTFISENYTRELSNPEEQIALFTLDAPGHDFMGNGIFGIDKNGNHFVMRKEYSNGTAADISALTFDDVNAEANVLTKADLAQSSDFIYNGTVDITLGAGIEEPAYK